MKRLNKLAPIFHNKQLFIGLIYLFFIVIALFISFISRLNLVSTLTVLGYALILSYVATVLYLYKCRLILHRFYI